MRKLLDIEWQSVRAFGPDLILYHPKSIAVPHIAEALDIPSILASPLPGFTPTRAFPSPLLPFGNLGPFNRASHLLAMHAAQLLFGKMLGNWRSETLGLSMRGRPRNPVRTVYAYSRHVLPAPPDWGRDVLVSGYWFLDDEDWVMPDSLARFLADGDPPVYVGFGSMPGFDPRHLANVAIEALAATGKRGLLAIGGGAIEVDEAPPHIHVIDSAPHDQLFKHVAATVHHGGAGTTGASIRAGIPTVLCPFFGDQPFWARRVQHLGIAPAPLDRRRLDAASFGAALRAIDAPDMRANARRIGELVRAEDGVKAATDFVVRGARLN
jgi:UDP:flavonoid glycosyltransferase YjiC (YdhE family)